jgi:hypothetical protein
MINIEREANRRDINMRGRREVIYTRYAGAASGPTSNKGSDVRQMRPSHGDVRNIDWLWSNIIMKLAIEDRYCM